MLAVAVALAVAWSAQADSIRTVAGIGHRGTIVGLKDGSLVIELPAGSRAIPLGEIAKINVDGHPDLARAEAAYARGLAGGSGAAAAYREAERLYRAMTRRAIPKWLGVLIQSRMYKLYAASGRASEALDAYLEMARGDPALVAGLKLPKPRQEAGDANRRMLQKVEAALRAAGGRPHAKELNRLRVALLLLEGTPEQVLPLLEPLLKSPNQPERHWAILKQLELLVALGRIDEAEGRLSEAARQLGPSYASEIAFWRGRVFHEHGLHVDAALEFMRLAILYPTKDRGRTAESLWRAGKAMEAAGLPSDEIVAVYKEAVQKYVGTAGAERAKRELARLGSG